MTKEEKKALKEKKKALKEEKRLAKKNKGKVVEEAKPVVEEKPVSIPKRTAFIPASEINKATEKPAKETKAVVEEKPAKETKTKVSEPDSKSKPAYRNYHISFRKDDNKWQVKGGGDEKAIKLFKTQSEAIDYAKKLAENNEGSITIHKLDGKIRKQNYAKKEEK